MKAARWPYVAEMRAEGRVEGRVEGHAEAIVEVLEDRDIAMEETDRERILACDDPKTLRIWLRAALTISKISDLFEVQAS